MLSYMWGEKIIKTWKRLRFIIIYAIWDKALCADCIIWWSLLLSFYVKVYSLCNQNCFWALSDMKTAKLQHNYIISNGCWTHDADMQKCSSCVKFKSHFDLIKIRTVSKFFSNCCCWTCMLRNILNSTIGNIQSVEEVIYCTHCLTSIRQAVFIAPSFNTS